MRHKSDAKVVQFSVEQIEWLQRTFCAAPILPSWTMQDIMYQAGQQHVISVIAARQYTPNRAQV